LSPRRQKSPPDWTAAQPERDLRAAIRREAGVLVLTGGQTGVDTAAAVAALRVGLRVHLVFPRGFLQEDGSITLGRRRDLRGATFHELESADFAQRTWTCVYLADVVVLLDPVGGDGCQETIRAASSLARPLLSLEVGRDVGDRGLLGSASGDLAAAVSSFLVSDNSRVVMFAGCRASLLAHAGQTAGVRATLDAIMPWVARRG
jgi:hypothetical protein